MNPMIAPRIRRRLWHDRPLVVGLVIVLLTVVAPANHQSTVEAAVQKTAPEKAAADKAAAEKAAAQKAAAEKAAAEKAQKAAATKAAAETPATPPKTIAQKAAAGDKAAADKIAADKVAAQKANEEAAAANAKLARLDATMKAACDVVAVLDKAAEISKTVGEISEVKPLKYGGMTWTSVRALMTRLTQEQKNCAEARKAVEAARKTP